MYVKFVKQAVPGGLFRHPNSLQQSHNSYLFFRDNDNNSVAAGPTVRKILSPPIMACLAGLVIGLSPPLRWLLMREGAPLGPMWAAFSNLVRWK